MTTERERWDQAVIPREVPLPARSSALESPVWSVPAVAGGQEREPSAVVPCPAEFGSRDHAATLRRVTPGVTLTTLGVQTGFVLATLGTRRSP